MTTTSNESKIHKDMTIADILGDFTEKAPQLVEIMTAAGLHCVGCEASVYETLEQGVLGHGFNAATLDALVVDLNLVLSAGSENENQGPFNMTMTERAIKQVLHMMTMEEKVGFLLRVSVLPGGCSGFSYDMKFVEEKQQDDVEMEHHGLTVFVDPKSTEMLHGIEIDYVMSLNESGFKYRNPNANSSCGCGMSFN